MEAVDVMCKGSYNIVSYPQDFTTLLDTLLYIITAHNSSLSPQMILDSECNISKTNRCHCEDDADKSN